MDPDETLRQIRAQIAARTTADGGDPDILFDLVEALDEWLSRGGYLPGCWTADRDRQVTP